MRRAQRVIPGGVNSPVRAYGSVGGVARGNDSCFAPIPIGVGSMNGATVGATNDGTTTCGISTGPDVWYQVRAPCSGTYRFTTCGGVTNYDSVVSVHTGCPGSAANSIACNDDACGPVGGAL